jgi:hypothetical protein
MAKPKNPKSCARSKTKVIGGEKYTLTTKTPVSKSTAKTAAEIARTRGRNARIDEVGESGKFHVYEKPTKKRKVAKKKAAPKKKPKKRRVVSAKRKATATKKRKTTTRKKK